MHLSEAREILTDPAFDRTHRLLRLQGQRGRLRAALPLGPEHAHLQFVVVVHLVLDHPLGHVVPRRFLHGLVAALALFERFDVVGLDIDEGRIAELRGGQILGALERHRFPPDERIFGRHYRGLSPVGIGLIVGLNVGRDLLIPGLVVIIAVLAFNLMGDGLRDALDPKLKK